VSTRLVRRSLVALLMVCAVLAHGSLACGSRFLFNEREVGSNGLNAPSRFLLLVSNTAAVYDKQLYLARCVSI
jgi:hypothetical protein